MAVPVGEHRVVRHAKRAVRLQGSIEHAVEHVGDVELDERDLHSRGRCTLAVDQPGGMQHEQPRGADLGSAIGNPVLDGLARTKHSTWRDLTSRGVAAEDIESALADANPPHAVMNAPGTEALLRHCEAFAFLAEQVRLRYAAVGEPHFGVAGPIRAFLTHDGDVANHLEPWRAHWHQDLAGALM